MQDGEPVSENVASLPQFILLSAIARRTLAKKGIPPPPRTKTSRKSASQYLRLLSSHGKNVSLFRQAYALSSLFIIQVKGNSGEEGVFFLNVNQRNKFLCRLNFPSFRLCASRPTGYSATSKRIGANLPPLFFLSRSTRLEFNASSVLCYPVILDSTPFSKFERERERGEGVFSRTVRKFEGTLRYAWRSLTRGLILRSSDTGLKSESER